MSTDPVPDPTAPEAASRIGDILATAERQVTEILAQADRQAAEVHAESARLLEARSQELEEIAAGLVAAAAAAQAGLERLRALEPLDLPATHGGAHGALALTAGAPEAATPDAGAPDAAAPQAPAPDAANAAPEAAGADDAAASPDAPRNGGSSSGGAGILHRPAEWVGFGEPAGRAEPAADAASRDEHAAADPGASGAPAGAGGTTVPPSAGVAGPAGSPAGSAPAAQGASPAGDAASPAPEASPDELADMPIIAESDSAPYPQDAPEKIDSARLVALSMAANGRSREEVEAHVRDELGIVDHAALIDYVFGISAPSSIVPSWPPRRRRRGA
ncbi:hypothetical protein [Patulibacter americanus]|uniref:hypothetical protein n=1 Tax=Patulibacter americanus TaxID=588672 RepID=UPI0003B65B85|nr:hypothetical protein [Patulibacter americanus]